MVGLTALALIRITPTAIKNIRSALIVVALCTCNDVIKSKNRVQFTDGVRVADCMSAVNGRRTIRCVAVAVLAGSAFPMIARRSARLIGPASVTLCAFAVHGIDSANCGAAVALAGVKARPRLRRTNKRAAGVLVNRNALLEIGSLFCSPKSGVALAGVKVRPRLRRTSRAGADPAVTGCIRAEMTIESNIPRSTELVLLAPVAPAENDNRRSNRGALVTLAT